ncbi:endonuclease domain of the non-LTR retrotransposon LINE-1 [Elysia marginata]|uniref:Endonuclease domain of the non-LTR retrotransposon LINE-1 n=1 Tax=Elysia marginata TaxID=1093978 RepID=A0AAV4EQN9_9GAST|nr:endonuclease domain of the non-LTR retrotransposon LINE-1 [Elysia marginata]
MIGLALLYILVLRFTIQAAILSNQNNTGSNNKGQHMHLSVKPAHVIRTLTDENFNGTGTCSDYNYRETKTNQAETQRRNTQSNVRYITNKMEELYAYAKYDETFRVCSLLCFTESSLQPEMSDGSFKLDNFTLFRGDRDLQATGKLSGGGVCMYVNTKWCSPHNIYVKHKHCDQHIELLTLSVRPYYLPREFSHILVTTVYIYPISNYTQASETLSSHIHDIQTQSPDAFIIVSGDFNDCPRKTLLSFLHQLVDTPTRGDNCLDLLFTNIPNSHVCQKLWALGNSDHSLVYLRPKWV